MRWCLLGNALLFQLGWLACILAASQPWWLLGGLVCLAAQLWLSHERQNDLRLVLGTRLDVSEDDDPWVDPDDPDAGALIAYGYLGELLEASVRALTGSLPEDPED